MKQKKNTSIIVFHSWTCPCTFYYICPLKALGKLFQAASMKTSKITFLQSLGPSLSTFFFC